MFNALSTLILVLASFSLSDRVAASNICAFTTRPCTGLSTCCNNIAAGVCCQWGSTFGAGVQFTNMPQPWSGHTFGPVACVGQAAGGASSSSGPVCLVTQPNQNFFAANWLAQPLRRRGEEIEARDDAAAPNCASPDTISYTTTEGVERVVKVPEGQFERLSGLIEVGSFQAEFALLEDA